MNYIGRQIKAKIEELTSSYPAVAIVGLRQVGKTTLAKSIKSDRQIIYLDLERGSDRNHLKNPELYFKINQDKLIILDEIQHKPDLFPLLRSVIDEHRVPGRFLLLGSASPEILKQGSESLAGRIAYRELPSLGLLEITDSKKDVQIILNHILKGGLPESYLAKDGFFSDWLEEFINSYIQRDLPILGMPSSPSDTRRLMHMIAHIHGNLLNTSNLAKSMGITSVTIAGYLNFLEKSFLIRTLNPYYVNLKKRLVKSPKIYYKDSGILCSLLSIDNIDDLHSHPQIGNIWEGYVIENIHNVLKKKELFFYRTAIGQELDGIITKNSKPVILFDAKYSSSPKLSRKSLTAKSDLGNLDTYMIVPENKGGISQIDHNLFIADLYSFLQLLIKL